VPRHGPSARRQWASLIAGWLVMAAVLGGLAAVEAVRVAEARATVPVGWSAGLAAGAGIALALSALVAGLVLVQLHRRWPRRGGWPLLIIVGTAALLLLVAAFTSATLRPMGPNRAPYVVTSAIGVAEIAYVMTCLALLAVLPAILIPAAQARRRRSDYV
jgi:DMSO reductase anchor subunit